MYTKVLYLLIPILFPLFLSAQVDNYSAGLQGQKLDWLMFYLDKHYVDDSNIDSLTNVAIRAVVNALDPYSSYQTKEEAEKQRNSDNGYSGEAIGFSYFILRDTAIVTYINIGGPAEKAGLMRGDKILQLNGQSVIGVQGKNFLGEVVSDKEQKNLNLTILRKNKGQFPVNLEKALIPWSSVNAGYMIDDRIGYIKIGRFTLKTMEEFVPTVKYLSSLGMQEMIIDLRDNVGGVKVQALALADIFIEGGKLIHSAEGENLERDTYTSEPGGIWEKGKVVILQNAKTASASEIFISAMQEWDRAVIMGTSTYGKGLIQQSYKLGDGSNIRLTVGRYYTPTGRHIQRTGGNNNDWLTPYQSQLSENSMTSSLNVPTELKAKSMSGRPLLAGKGGIIPDIYYQWNDTRDYTYLNTLKNNSLIYPFVTDYVADNREAMYSEYNTVREFIDDRIREAYMLQQFRKYLREAAPSLVLQPEFTETVIWQLKTWMASQLWHDNAFYEVENADDRLLFRAKEVLDGKVHDILGIGY